MNPPQKRSECLSRKRERFDLTRNQCCLEPKHRLRHSILTTWFVLERQVLWFDRSLVRVLIDEQFVVNKKFIVDRNMSDFIDTIFLFRAGDFALAFKNGKEIRKL